MTRAARRSGSAYAVFAGVLLLLASLLSPLTASAAERYASVVMDAGTGEILYERYADDLRYPASVTKVMTLYVTFAALSDGSLKLTDKVTISPRAARQPPSKLGLRAGDKITVEQAIFALCTKSANDVAVALAERVAGSEAKFEKRMNERARKLGMTKTRFVNPHGLPDPRHVSTAHDLAILSRAVQRDFPKYYAYFGAQSFTFRGHRIRNHNGLLGHAPGVDGIKTGYTRASGFNLAASGVRDGRRLIVVVLGGRSSRSRNDHVAELLDAGFAVLRARKTDKPLTIAGYLAGHGGELTPVSDETAVAMGDEDETDAGEEGEEDVGVETPAPTPAVTPAAVREAKATTKTTAPAKTKAEAGAWQIQVGAFKKRSDANAALKDVRKRFRAQVEGAAESVSSAGGWHRARFTGLSEDAAGAACEALKSRKLPCLVLHG